MSLSGSFNVVSGAIRASVVSPGSVPVPAAAPAARPVITISREAGLDAGAVGQALAARLNGGADGVSDWQAFDRELIECVAREHHLSTEEVAARDEHDESVVEFAIHGFSSSTATAEGIPLKIAATVRHLAERGNVIIVGRGGQAILADRADAVHVRLVAPEAWRVEQHAAATGLDRSAATKAVRRLDADRARYIRAHFSRDVADPLLYHLVLNMAALTQAQAVAAMAGLVAPD